MKVALALGGGGARGLAHLGVLKILEAHSIPIDLIVGTSIGALVGGAYAQHPDARKLEARVLDYIESPQFHEAGLDRFKRKEPAENFFGQVAKYVRERIVINLAHRRLSVVGMGRMRRVIEAVLDEGRIEETRIPLVIVATDLRSGRDCYFDSGDIREAAMASSAIPGFLPPVQSDHRFLVDGAVTSPVPVDAARAFGADVVIAVDVGQDVNLNPETRSIIDIMFRTNTVTSHKLKEMLLQKADIIIRPRVGAVHWADFQNAPELIREGERAAQEQLTRIKLATSFWKRLLLPWLRSH